MRKFDISKLGEGVVVNCKTEKDANAFLGYLDSIDIIWYNKTKIFESVEYNFYTYKEQTCFALRDGRLLYSPKEWHKEGYYKILDISEIEIFENIQQPTPKNNFKEYGFESDFEGEIFKKINNELFGIIFKKDNASSLVVIWSNRTGKCYGNEAQEYQEYNLTPIKKPWYTQEENFEKYQGKLIINKFGEVRKIQYVDNNKVSTTHLYMYPDTLISQEWRLVNEEDTIKLIYKEDK